MKMANTIIASRNAMVIQSLIHLKKQCRMPLIRQLQSSRLEIEETEIPALSEEEYIKLCADSEQAKVYDGRGTYDLYVCDDCSHQIVTTYAVKGVTPFVIKCPECEGSMKHIATYKSIRPKQRF